MCLHRKNTGVKPLKQRQIIGKRAQECHRRVGVCVFESRQNQIVLRINLAVP